MSSGINNTSIVQADASSTPVGPLSVPSTSSPVEVLSSNGATVLVQSSGKAPSAKRASQMCQVRGIAEQLFTCALDQPLAVSDRRFSVLSDFVEKATAIVKQLMEKTDHNIARVLKELGATDEMVQYAIVNKIDIGKLVHKVVSISRAVHSYRTLSTQLAAAPPGSAEAQAIQARMKTVLVRAVSVALLLPSLAKLVTPSAGPLLISASIFFSYTTEVVGDSRLRDPYPGMSQRYRIVAATSNALGMVASGSLIYSLLMQEKQDPDSVLAKAISTAETASTAVFGAWVAYDIFLTVGPPIVAARDAAVRVAQAAAPRVRTVGLVVAYNLLEFGVDLTGRIAEVFSFFEGKRFREVKR